MKSTSVPVAPDRPTEAEIRAFAHEIYIRSGWLPGRDLENWLEAEAILMAERQLRAHGPAHARQLHPHQPAQRQHAHAHRSLSRAPTHLATPALAHA